MAAVDLPDRRARRALRLYPVRRGWYVNFGFWDVKRTREAHPAGHFNRLIEDKVSELGGIKSLYSDSFFTERRLPPPLRRRSLRRAEERSTTLRARSRASTTSACSEARGLSRSAGVGLLVRGLAVDAAHRGRVDAQALEADVAAAVDAHAVAALGEPACAPPRGRAARSRSRSTSAWSRSAIRVATDSSPAIGRRPGEVFVRSLAHALDVLAQLGEQRGAALLDRGVQLLGLLAG